MILNTKFLLISFHVYIEIDLFVLKQLFIAFQELFIQKLAQDALKGQRHFRHLEYNDLARAVEENENMYFLRGKFFFVYMILQ